MRLVGIFRVGIGRPRAVAHALVENEVEGVVERPLSVVEIILYGGLLVAAHFVAVHRPYEPFGLPDEAIDVPVFHVHPLAERRFRVVFVAERIGPVRVNRVVGRVLGINRLENIDFATRGPRVGRRLRHHPRGGEIPLVAVRFQAHFHLSVGEREAAFRLHRTRNHRHVVGRGVGVGNGAANQRPVADVGHFGRGADPAVPRGAAPRRCHPFRRIGQRAVGLVEFVTEDERVAVVALVFGPNSRGNCHQAKECQ